MRIPLLIPYLRDDNPHEDEAVDSLLSSRLLASLNRHKCHERFFFNDRYARSCFPSRNSSWWLTPTITHVLDALPLYQKQGINLAKRSVLGLEGGPTIGPLS